MDTAGIASIDQRVTDVSRRLENLHTMEDKPKKICLQKEKTALENGSSSHQRFKHGYQDSIVRYAALGSLHPLLSMTFHYVFASTFVAHLCYKFNKFLQSMRERQLLSSGLATLRNAAFSAGAGKSILASIIVDYLRKVQTKTESFGVAALYCNFKEERQTQTTENLLAGVCVQLAKGLSGSLPTSLVDIHESHSRLKTRPTLTEILKVLDDIVHDLDAVYVVIDALDECPEQTRNTLLTRTEALPESTRLLMTTLYVDDIINRYRDCPKIEIRATDNDLAKYITSRIASNNRLTRLVRGQATLEHEICERVKWKADGMFLAAKFHVDALSTKTNVKKLRKALENLPTTLYELYDNAFQRIKAQSQDDQQLALKALRWVAYTYRPLSLRALQEALAIEPGEEDFDRDSLHPIGLILDVCPGLVAADSQNEVVRLVHTAQDYMDGLLTSEYQDAHTSIAGDCITYLSYRDFHIEDRLPRSYMWSFILLPYASTFWATHATARRTPELESQIDRYLAVGPSVNFTTTRDSDEEHSYNWLYFMANCPGLGIAAFFGLCGEIQSFLQYTIDINELLCPQMGGIWVSESCSALHLAAQNDQIEAVSILLEHGADIENKTSNGRTPLLVAFDSQALTVAKKLISRGGNVMAERSRERLIPGYIMCKGEIPFQMVWWSSSIPFLQYMIGAGTILERRHLFHSSLLMRKIIDDNDLQTGQWLFESALKDRDRTLIPCGVLGYAASYGSVRFVNKLLDYGAEINSKDSQGGTALHFACDSYAAETSSRVSAIKALFERGLDVKTRNNEGQTALHQAVQNGHQEIVKTLITYNAHLNVQDEIGSTPLHRAVRSRRQEMVETLITSNAHPNIQDETGSTPLIHAMDLDQTSIALQLLRHGADVNIQDANGMIALHFACARGNLEIVQKLMEQQASVEFRSLFTLTVKPTELEGGHPQWSFVETCHGIPIEVFAVSKWESREVSRELKVSLLMRETYSEWKVWKQGMTAMDFALIHENEQIIGLLESANQSNGPPDVIPYEEYLLEFFGLSTMDEVMETLQRKTYEEETT
ncbi:MAG: hypothetical protein Q9226_007903 [Calogaya cf. arnoldii]